MAITITPTLIGSDHGRLVYRVEVTTTAGTTTGTSTITNATLVADSIPGGALNNFLTNNTFTSTDAAIAAMCGTNKLRVTKIFSPSAVNSQLTVTPTPDIGFKMQLLLTFNLNAAADAAYTFTVELEFNYLNTPYNVPA
jgi:hypothetical protein